MSKPKRQHFIPRSYLNKFGNKFRDKYFIYGKKRDSEVITPKSTKDICVNKNLYTIPTEKDGKKYDIENFYADKIDSVFPEIYSVIKDESIIHLDFKTRLKIINSALSLYFRTPKYLNIQNKFFEEVIEKAFKKTRKDNITVLFMGEELNIERSEAQQIIKEKKENNRIKFLFQHLESYQKFVECKLLDNMAVYHINDDSEFITSDNPVIIRPFPAFYDKKLSYENYHNEPINPFRQSNMIHLPMDSKTILTLIPTKKTSNLFQRLYIGNFDVLQYNLDIEENSEMWILGSENGISKHLKEKNKLNSKEYKKQAEEYTEKVDELKNLTNLMEKYGYKHELVKDKVIELEKKPFIFSDINFQKICRKVKN